MAEVKKERLVFAILHELEGLFGDCVVGIRNAVGLFRAERRIFFFAEWIGSVVYGGKVFGAVCHTAVDTAILISKFKPIMGGGESCMPFPNVAGTVTIPGRAQWRGLARQGACGHRDRDQSRRHFSGLLEWFLL